MTFDRTESLGEFTLTTFSFSEWAAAVRQICGAMITGFSTSIQPAPIAARLARLASEAQLGKRTSPATEWETDDELLGNMARQKP
jgi:hypothetical protein